MNEEEKKKILEEIEALMRYSDREEATVHPALLHYLDEEALRSIRDKLRAKRNRLTEEDKEWLKKFRKEE